MKSSVRCDSLAVYRNRTSNASLARSSNFITNAHSQLLDLLLDINDSNKIPPSLRYDLRSPTPNASDVPALEPDLAPRSIQDIENARAALREATYELECGQITRAEFDEHETSLSNIIHAPLIQEAPKSLANLSKTTHTTLSSVDETILPPDLLEESPIGYLTPSHEDEMVRRIDDFLETAPPDSNFILPRQNRPTDKEREKDAQLHNPVSVYNWLKAHSEKAQKTYPQDVEADPHPSSAQTSEPPHKSKPSPKPPSSTGTSTKPTRKRASSSLVPKQEPEEILLDEEGYVINAADEVPEKKKRKRENDESYRPKGGSSRSKKRAKGSSGAAVKKIEEEDDDGA